MPWWVTFCARYCYGATVYELWTARHHPHLWLVVVGHAPVVALAVWVLMEVK